jgi:ABC-type glycerol-3-phosphate transport system substrate-binding protein
MKKIAIFLFLAVFVITGCEEKEPPPVTISGNINVWVSENGSFWEAVGREFISIFESPNLTVTVVSFENEKELQNTLLNSMAEGNGPDIVFTDSDWIAHNKGKLVPLQNDESLTPEKFQQFFVPSSVETLVEDQTIWGVPIAVDTLAVMYNAGHFAEVFDEGAELATTWEGFRDQVEALNIRNKSFQRFARAGAAIGRGDNIVRGTETCLNLFMQLVGDLFSEDGTEAIFAENKGVTATGERVDFALQSLKFFLGFAKESVSYHSWNELLVDSESKEKDFEAFIKGDVSMIFGTARDLKHIESLFKEVSDTIPKNNVKVGFLPQFEEVGDGVSREVLASVSGLAVTSSSKNPNFSWQFLKFALQLENLQGFSTTSGIPSAHQQILVQQESGGNTDVFIRQAKVAKAHLFPIPRTDVLEAFDTLLDRIHDNKATPSEGLLQTDEALTNQIQRKQTLLQTLSK